MRAAPGSLLKRQTLGASTLSPTPQSRNLTEHLHDLITITYERSTNRRSSSLRLEQLQYVLGENSGGKYSMHFAGLVKEANHPEYARIKVTITVSKEDPPCSDQ